MKNREILFTLTAYCEGNSESDITDVTYDGEQVYISDQNNKNTLTFTPEEFILFADDLMKFKNNLIKIYEKA